MNYPRQPYFHDQKPEEPLFREKVKEVEEYYDGQIIEQSDTEIKRVSLELDYTGCYYESDTPSIKCQFITNSREKYTNPKYARELAKYEKDKAAYEKAMDKYKNDMLAYEVHQKKKQEMLEKKQYIALKKKFEKLSKKFEDTK